MIHFTRTVTIAPGKLGEALTFAREISRFVEQHYDRKLEVSMPVSGNPHRIMWSTSYANLDAFEQFSTRTMSDPKYLEALHKGGTLFVAGSLLDELWRAI
jgi:hypothetical protein